MKYIKIIILVIVIIFAYSVPSFCQDPIKEYKTIFLILNPELISVKDIEKKLRVKHFKVIAKEIQKTYLIETTSKFYSLDQFNKIINEMHIELLRKILKPFNEISEIEKLQKKSPFNGMTIFIKKIEEIFLNENNDFELQIRLKVISDDMKVVNSLEYIVLNDVVVNKFILEAGLDRKARINSRQGYNDYFNDVKNSFILEREDDKEYVLKIKFSDEELVKKATDFFTRKIDEINNNLKHMEALVKVSFPLF